MTTFTTGQVEALLGLPASTLRFWEKEFDIINPRKTAKGTRFYTKEDIDAVRLIYHLVKERGLTLAGAKQKLKDNKDTVIRQEDIVNRLKAIREELNKLKEAFDALQPGNE
jgi:DNA-binding transcriptional MerR regulator